MKALWMNNYAMTQEEMEHVEYLLQVLPDLQVLDKYSSIAKKLHFFNCLHPFGLNYITYGI